MAWLVHTGRQTSLHGSCSSSSSSSVFVDVVVVFVPALRQNQLQVVASDQESSQRRSAESQGGQEVDSYQPHCTLLFTLPNLFNSFSQFYSIGDKVCYTCCLYTSINSNQCRSIFKLKEKKKYTLVQKKPHMLPSRCSDTASKMDNEINETGSHTKYIMHV